LFQLHLFHRPAVVGGLLVALSFFSGTGFFFVLSLHLQEGLGFSPLATGLAFLAFPAGVVLGSGASIALAQKAGRATVTLGGLATAIGTTEMLAAVRSAGLPLQGWELAPGFAAAGFGTAIVSATLVNLVMASVPEPDTGAAAGLIQTAIQIGNAVAVAGSGSVFFSVLNRHLGSVAAVEASLWLELALVAGSVVLSIILPIRSSPAGLWPAAASQRVAAKPAPEAGIHEGSTAS
jgi:predicted MFS family arabinose efflux permease